MNQYHADGFPEIYYLSNLDASGRPSGRHPDKGTVHWHTDGSWARRTGQATLLYADQVPSEGGETRFASMYDAYDALDAAMKRAAGHPACDPFAGFLAHAPARRRPDERGAEEGASRRWRTRSCAFIPRPGASACSSATTPGASRACRSTRGGS